MSALAASQNTLFVRAQRRMTELDATRQISRAAASATKFADGIEAFARIALLVKGIERIELVPGEPLRSQIPKPLAFGPNSSSATPASAIADIAAEGKKWGELRVFFELHPSSIEQPLQFAKYVGQQIAILLGRLELLVERESLKRKAQLFKTLVARRKAIHRARALLVHTHNISEDAALVLLRRHTRESGRSLHAVAEAIIFSDQQKWRRPGALRFPLRRK
jgi:hypothetical protein